MLNFMLYLFHLFVVLQSCVMSAFNKDEFSIPHRLSGYHGNGVVAAQRCPHPGHVPNSHRLNPALFYFPNNITYSCLEGYRLIGNAERRCLETGQWSGRLPICRRMFINCTG